MKKCIKCGRFFEKNAYCPDDWIPLVEVPQDLSNTKIGNYLLIRPLGRGGMGTVYLGEHTLIKRRVAIKMLHQDLAKDQVSLSRFFTEARVVNEIRHENIVDIIDLQQLPNNTTFLVMEFLAGENLGSVLRRVSRFDVARTLHISIQVAEALAAAHDHNVLHRDLKPDNIYLIDNKGIKDFVKILDFGLAKLLDPDSDPGNTATGHTVGTPYYMAPEQCEGKRDIDGRADVYALGVIMYHCLSGVLPFDGKIRGNVMLEHLCDPLPPIRERCPDLPRDVEQIILCSLEKEKENRYRTMHEMVAALRKAKQRIELSVNTREQLPNKKKFVPQSWDTIPDGMPPVDPRLVPNKKGE